MATTPSTPPTPTAPTTPIVHVRLAANTFFAFNFSPAAVVQWGQDLADLDHMISSAAAPNGVDETTLLNWFGATVERIALLAYALHSIVPTHVARELTIGDFRADFGWADLDPSVNATVGLIELESCEPTTLFQKKGRKAPYLGTRFLGGFGQLVDWCSFGQAQAATDANISQLLGRQHVNARYVFAVVAGHHRFCSDHLSQRRMQWWNDNVKIGHGTSTATFDEVARQGAKALDILQRAK